MNSDRPKINLIFEKFTQVSRQKNKQYNSQELFWHILAWTEANPHLTIKMCQYILLYSKNIAFGQESIFVEQLFINYLLKEPALKQLSHKLRRRIYYQKFSQILNQNQGVISSTMRSELIVISRNLALSAQQIEQIEKLVLSFLIQNKSQKKETKLNSLQLPKVAVRQPELNLSGKKPKKNQKTHLLSLFCLLIGLLSTEFWFKKSTITDSILSENQTQNQKFCSAIKQNSSNLQMSWGEKRLISEDPSFTQIEFTQTVKRGIEAFADCNFQQAATYLKKSLKSSKNNPEIVIYSNNAQVATKPHLSIAVSVPIGGNQEIAQEILRGVAQAQTEINREGGIEGKLLSVKIANDDNKPEIAQEIAAQLIQQSKILAVVGHGSSDTSVAASKIYQQGKLVMISPTSAATELSGIGNYIFRTIPDVKAFANSLGNYTVKLSKKTKIAFCGDSDSTISRSFLKEFSLVMKQNQGQLLDIGCDFTVANFNPSQFSFSRLYQKAEALLLVPSIESIDKAIALAKVNHNQLPLLSSHSMYMFETIQEGQAAVDNMILPVPWQPGSIPHNSFPQTARKMWGGNVNWRTAMAYDATVVIIQGLKETPTRHGLQLALSDQRFAVNGATGQFRFENGDRNSEALLVQVKQVKNKQGNNYQFFPLKQQKKLNG